MKFYISLLDPFDVDEYISFSKRIGLESTTKQLQIDSMDKDLRNSIWNMIYRYYGATGNDMYVDVLSHPTYSIMFTKLSLNFYKSPIDDLQYTRVHEEFESMKTQIITDFDWNQVYDLIQFFAAHLVPIRETSEKFIESCNIILKREFSGYRFTGNIISPITNKSEINEIETAMETPVSTANQHISRALELLSDRNQPDYRNSIKESISAIETICKKIVNDENTTLGRALNKIESTGQVKIHTDIKEAFQKQYNYTSDADGIRHSMMNISNTDFEDAKLMLVSCSAFMNYLITKSIKAKISLK